MIRLGYSYSEGMGVPPNYALAEKWYRKAMEEGDTDGMVDLGYLYLEGKGVKQDCAMAATWFRTASEQGNAGAMTNVGKLYVEGTGVSQDYKQAAEWYRKAADLGDSDAMHNLGTLYRDGHGVPQDPVQAATWFRKSIKGGSASGMNDLGNFYMEGLGVGQDFAAAVMWYRKAANLGSLESMANLGVAYRWGWGIPEDSAQAAAWWRRAAERGFTVAMFQLGTAYCDGIGVPQDYAEAAKWFRNAAQRGDKNSMDYLGVLYDVGLGVPKNTAQAETWFQKAAQQGGVESNPNLSTDSAKILTKYLEIPELLRPPQGDALLNMNPKFLEERKRIEDVAARIQDPDLRSRVFNQGSQNLQKRVYIEQVKRRLADEFPYILQRLFADHRDGWFELGHISLVGTSVLDVTQVEASPLTFPKGATVAVNIANLDSAYSKFRDITNEQIQRTVASQVKQNSCEERLRHACENLGGGSEKCSDPHELENIRATLQFSCGYERSAEEQAKTLTDRMRGERIVLVGQGDVLAKQIKKLMLVDYDTETILLELPPTALTGERRWKSPVMSDWVKSPVVF